MSATLLSSPPPNGAELADLLLDAANPVVSTVFMAVYVAALTVFREPTALWKRGWAVAFGVIAAGSVTLVLLAGYDTYLRFSFITMLANCGVTLIASKPGILRALFAQLTASFIGMFAQANTSLVLFFAGDDKLLALAVRALSLGAMYLFLRAFADRYSRVLHTLHRGWGILCLAPGIVFFVNLLALNALMASMPVQGLVIQYGMLGVCAVFYAVVFLLFAKVQEENEVRQAQSTLALQVTALRERMRMLDAAEAHMRIERHDLRHRLRIIEELLQREDTHAALSTLGVAEQRLAETEVKHWCANATLDAVFGLYFEQARRRSIRVTAHLAIPESLPVPAEELSVVVANALENALAACEGVPDEQREIVCRAIASPQLMMSFENPYAGTVHIGANGLPQTDKPDHGFGMQSLAAFCEKHGALYECTAHEGRFKLSIAL